MGVWLAVTIKLWSQHCTVFKFKLFHYLLCSLYQLKLEIPCLYLCILYVEPFLFLPKLVIALMWNPISEYQVFFIVIQSWSAVVSYENHPNEYKCYSSVLQTVILWMYLHFCILIVSVLWLITLLSSCKDTSSKSVTGRCFISWKLSEIFLFFFPSAFHRNNVTYMDSIND